MRVLESFVIPKASIVLFPNYSKFFWATFICYVVWLLLFTFYILMTYLINCPCKFYTDHNQLKTIIGKRVERQVAAVDMDSIEDSLNISESREEMTGDISGCIEGSSLNITFFFLLLILTAIMAMNEISKILVTPKLYYRSSLNILHWVLLVLSILTFYPTFTRQTQLSSQQYQVAALTIFLAWSLILSQVGKFPSIGIYLEIFGHVLRQFWFFLLTYISLFIAFALAFSILFPGTQPYTIFPFAFLKIFVMMIGEMEYQDVFYDETTGKAAGPIVGHLLYATFVVVVAIVLMNLLIGLTVSDIRGLRKEAEMYRVTRQIIDMFHLESFLFSKKIPNFIQKPLHRMTSVAVQLAKQHGKNARSTHTHDSNNERSYLTPSNKYVFKFLPNDSRDKSVPEKYKAASMELALKLEQDKREKVCVRKKFYQQMTEGNKIGFAREYLDKSPMFLERAKQLLTNNG